jgi:hypothetical protein
MRSLPGKLTALILGIGALLTSVGVITGFWDSQVLHNTQDTAAVEIVLDASASMNEPLDPRAREAESKWGSAKRFVMDFTATRYDASDDYVALRRFGGSCASSVMAVDERPLVDWPATRYFVGPWQVHGGNDNQTGMRMALDAIQPGGDATIWAAVEDAIGHLIRGPASLGKARRQLVLIYSASAISDDQRRHQADPDQPGRSQQCAGQCKQSSRRACPTDRSTGSQPLEPDTTESSPSNRGPGANAGCHSAGHGNIDAHGYTHRASGGHFDVRCHHHADSSACGYFDTRRRGDADVAACCYFDVPSRGHADAPSCGYADGAACCHADIPSCGYTVIRSYHYADGHAYRLQDSWPLIARQLARVRRTAGDCSATRTSATTD